MRRLVAGAACLLLLTGCSGKLSPRDTLKNETAQLIDAANAKSTAGVRSAAAELRTTIQDQLASGDLTPAQAETLRKLLATIESEVDLLTSPTASPTPSPTATATPSPTASPTPSPTASPTPSPTPSPTRSPTASPTPVATSPPPSIGIGVGDPSPVAS